MNGLEATRSDLDFEDPRIANYDREEASRRAEAEDRRDVRYAKPWVESVVCKCGCDSSPCVDRWDDEPEAGSESRDSDPWRGYRDWLGQC